MTPPRPRSPRIWSCALLAAVCALLPACGDEHHLTPVPKPGTNLKVGFKDDHPGLSLFDTKSAKALGFEPVLAGRLLEDGLGYAITQVQLTTGNWQQELTNGSVDLIVSTVSYTAGRNTDFIFAGPYLASPLGALTRKDSHIPKSQLHSLHGLRVCAITGTTAAEALSRASSDKTILTVPAADDTDCRAAIDNGSADIYLSDAVILLGRMFAAPNSPYSFVSEDHLAGTKPEDQSYAIALRPDEQALCLAIDKQLTKELDAAATQWNDDFRQKVTHNQLDYNLIDVYRPAGVNSDWCTPKSSQG